jgi:hypothetical protein
MVTRRQDRSSLSPACRILVLQTIRTNRLYELETICAALRETAPGCSIAVLVTPETFTPVAELGCAEELLAGYRHLGVLRIVRAARFNRVCIVNDGGGAPGQMRSDILALAARAREILWCTPDGHLMQLSTSRLVVRLLGEAILTAFAFGVGAAVGIVVAPGLSAIDLISGLRRRGR